MPIDFGYNGMSTSDDTSSHEENSENQSSTNLGTGEIEHDENGTPIEDLSNQSNGEENNLNGENGNFQQQEDNGAELENEPLTPGTTIDVGDDTYTVDENGNLLDANGNIFKEAKDVAEWMNNYDAIENNENDITLDNIQAALDIQITDDNNIPIEYENNIEGIKAYVNDVVNVAKEEAYNTAQNTMFNKYPFMRDMINYYVANGNSLEGFNEYPDRSNVVVDDNNVAQQEAIIVTAWREQNRKGDLDGYLAYLKSAGTLATVAREELKGLQENDIKRKQYLEDQARKQSEANVQRLRDYWNNVYSIVNARQLGEYQIPESIIIERGGKKFATTPNDFFNYLYRTDENGITQYEKDYNEIDPQQRVIDELLKAYLVYTGGSYSNLVDMAINKQQVDKLRLVAKQRRNSTIRINRPKPSGTKAADIDLGYN